MQKMTRLDRNSNTPLPCPCTLQYSQKNCCFQLVYAPFEGTTYNTSCASEFRLTSASCMQGSVTLSKAAPRLAGGAWSNTSVPLNP